MPLSYTKKGIDGILVIVLNDPFKWWKVNCHRFPLLSDVARRVLAIPATYSAVRKAFLCCESNRFEAVAASGVGTLSCCYFCARCGQCWTTFRPTTVLKERRGRGRKIAQGCHMYNSSCTQPIPRCTFL